MVRRQIAGRGVGDLRVLAAMEKVPREAFLPDALREFAYEDTPLPIEEGQTMSQPYIVARMADAAHIGPGDKVLEIGAGSGYAAAVLSELAERVFTIERHPALADLARARLEQLGYRNVDVRTGDGTLGWPEQAPFDAIIATAGGPRVPDSLRGQLSVGGRLVMPVGPTRSAQMLIRLTRTGPETWHQEGIEDVRFVPLIGEEGWTEDEARDRPARPTPLGLPQLVRAGEQALPDLGDPEFGGLFDRYGDRKVVLLGEASHGTSEFYRARAAITRRLIERHGFSFVAVEADWPEAAGIDRYVRHLPTRSGTPIALHRFPTWLWRNTDVAAFADWLRRHNATLPAERRAAFFGLDIYSPSDSIAAVLAYLDKVDPAAAKVARERYGCLTPWQHDPTVYGRAVLSERYRECEAEMVANLQDLLGKRLQYAARDGEQFFDAAQNARLVASAARYYRALYYGNAESWNLRDRHMFDTLTRLFEHRGSAAKGVVWAHNSHIGDARFTDMGRVRGELNLGELVRRRFADDAALIGFGTHSGTVAAASDWDGPMEVKEVRPSRVDSVERQFHDAGVPQAVLYLDTPGELRRRLRAPRLERFIGVIYRPESELQSHYAEVELPGQFDAFVWFDRTTAVTPLPTSQRTDAPGTWPFGL
ncbi:MAG: protein-L-isoaspartate(D-aspartate) O-methyltransferase [Alphaproteobacteria bacterium]|nr:protein-L-isoaspartate(D-aspartate) O-methyltransferase [Alphaproteobacteria bacterium]MBV8406682.1 protein-L-isoaspartate(D-aspartate) O-methyltransferase [Alphaproteobacteria bacterium]